MKGYERAFCPPPLFRVLRGVSFTRFTLSDGNTFKCANMYQTWIPKMKLLPFHRKKYRLLIKAMLCYETHHAFSVMLNKSPFIITHKNQ